MLEGIQNPGKDVCADLAERLEGSRGSPATLAAEVVHIAGSFDCRLCLQTECERLPYL